MRGTCGRFSDCTSQTPWGCLRSVIGAVGFHSECEQQFLANINQKT